MKTSNIQINLNDDLIARMKMVAMLKSENPADPIPWLTLVREALEATYTDKVIAHLCKPKGKKK